MESRFRLVATAISAILVVTACNTAASPSPTSPPAASASRRRSAPAASGSAAAGGRQFAGVTVHLLTFNGPQVAEPLQRRAPDFEKLTGGARSTSTRSASRTIYDKALLDVVGRDEQLRRRTSSTRSGWATSSAQATSQDLTERGQRRRATQLERHRAVLPRLQRDVRRQGLHDPARRRLPHGLLPERPARRTAKPPTTWDDYLAIAAEVSTARTSTATARRTTARASPRRRAPQSYWWIISVAARPAPGARAPAQGAFFDTTNMNPLFEQRRVRRRPSRPTRRRCSTARPTRSTSASATPAACSRPVAARCRWTGATSGRSRSTRHLDRPGQGRRDDHPGLEGESSTGRPASSCPCDATDLPQRGRRRELRPVRLVRRLVGRDQRGRRPGEEGRGLRVPRLHERPAQSGEDVTLGKTGFNPYRTSHFDGPARRGRPSA